MSTPKDALGELIETNAEFFNWLVTYGLDSALDAFSHVMPIPVARGVAERALYKYALKQVSDVIGRPADRDDFYRLLPALLSHATDEQIADVQTMLLSAVPDSLLFGELEARGLLTPVDDATLDRSVLSP